MAYALYQDIKIGNFRFSRSNSVEIRKSTHTIGATAIIKVPISAVIENQGEKSGEVEVQKAINVGDAVSILLGYHTTDDDYEKTEFKGWVKKINPKIPLEIECEDNNYLLRKKTINKSWKSTTLQEVLNEIVSDTDVELEGDIPEVDLKPFYIKNTDAAYALQKIADEYGLTIFFNSDQKMVVKWGYSFEEGSIDLILNGDDCNVINNNLEYRVADDVKLKVKGIGIQDDNTRIEVEVGDDDGALRTLYFYNIDNSASLTKLANQEIKKYKFDGYRGDLTCFLIPFCDPGYTVNITDSIFPDREGSYFVESTTLNYGSGGIRRKIELGIKVST